MNWGLNSPLWAIVFWANVVICLGLVVLVVRTIRKYETKKKQLKDVIDASDQKDVKWLFKNKLKEHGINEKK